MLYVADPLALQAALLQPHLQVEGLPLDLGHRVISAHLLDNLLIVPSVLPQEDDELVHALLVV